jgi:uncharacterized protein (UPF0333 family)
MEIILGVVLVVAIGALIYFNRQARSIDINADGKVDLADAADAVKNAAQGVQDLVQETAESIKKIADVDQNGKINTEDVKAAVSKARGSAAKKPATRRSAAKKPAAKKSSKSTS